VVQARLGYRDYEMGLYARIFFGLQLPVHLLFALLAFAVHVLVNHKYVGHMVVLTIYLLTAFAPTLGIEHNLLAYGAGPSWMYSDMSGFGPTLGPWLWFTLYWAAWALLLAVVATLFWVRSRELDVPSRLRLARRRLTRRVISAAAGIAALGCVAFGLPALVLGTGAAACVGLVLYAGALALVRPAGLLGSWRYLRSLA